MYFKLVCSVVLLALAVCSHRHHQHSPGGVRHHHHHHGSKQESPVAGTGFIVRGMIATIGISVLPYICLLLLPPFEKDHPALRLLLSFSAGALLGDSFLHLIPHSLLEFQSSSSSIEEAATQCGQTVLAGIIVFLVIDKMVRVWLGSHNHEKDEEVKPDADECSQSDQYVEEFSNLKRRVNPDVDKSEEETKPIVPTDNKSLHGHYSISPSGYLSLLADFTHNVTDGMAIGASFAAGRKIGYVTALSILLHEIPHELGDYALLIKSGVRPLQAAQLQLVTALGAILGCLISCMAVQAQAARTIIMPMTAGGFIYVATVSILPDLINNTKKNESSLLQIAAMVAGVACMVGVACLE